MIARRVRRLGWRLRVGAEIVLAYGRVRVEMRRADIRDVLAALRASSACAPLAADDLVHAAELGRAVNRVLAFAPSRSRCLVQSLVLTRMLARRGVDSSLVIGVTSGGTFGAHAWVEADGCPLLPSLTATYSPLVRM